MTLYSKLLFKNRFLDSSTPDYILQLQQICIKLYLGHGAMNLLFSFVCKRTRQAVTDSPAFIHAGFLLLLSI